MNTADLMALLDRLRAEPRETDWLEFSANPYEPQVLGEHLSALSNSDCLAGKPRGYLVSAVTEPTTAEVGACALRQCRIFHKCALLQRPRFS